jgi:hypothetical protein
MATNEARFNGNANFTILKDILSEIETEIELTVV